MMIEVVAMGTVATVERAGAPAPALLSVRGLTCRFGEVVANDGLDFDVAPGEVHAVLGENGAGKSTLMKLIYGVYRADAGELHVNGAPATIESPTAARAAGSTGSAVALEPLPDTVVAATGVSGCFGGPLETALREAGIDHVLLAGHGLEGPVHSTLRDLNDQGYECLLVADACTSGVPDTAAAAVSSVTMSGGIFGAVGSTDSVLTALTAIAVLTAVLEAPHDR